MTPFTTMPEILVNSCKVLDKEVNLMMMDVKLDMTANFTCFTSLVLHYLHNVTLVETGIGSLSIYVTNHNFTLIDGM